MNGNPIIDETQSALWNGVAGRAWVEAQELVDRIFKSFEDPLAESATAVPGGRVLDVGCGTGGTTLAAARRLAAKGRCTGIDISGPMIEAARARAERERIPATFMQDDAQVHAFERASFDVVISRFGVMFFEDFVRAFANLRTAARDGAAMRLIVWRGAAENPFMTTAERAAAPLLPNLPARRPGEPGQFAFADRHHVERILSTSGWGEIDLRPIDSVCTIPERELVPYVSRFGPVGRTLARVAEDTRKRVIETVRPAFDSFVHGDEVRFVAACWDVNARAA